MEKWTKLSMAKTVEKLMEKPCSKKELVEELVRFGTVRNTAYKQVMRNLKKLEAWRLVTRKGVTYYWYIYPNTSKDHASFETKLHHSQLLIPALKSIAGIEDRVLGVSYPTDRDGNPIPWWKLNILIDSAKEHLLFYPDLWETFKDYEDYNSEAKKIQSELEKELEKRIKDEIGIKPKEDPTTESFVLMNICKAIYDYINRVPSPNIEELITYNEVTEESHFNYYRVAKGMDPSVIKNFVSHQINDESIKSKVRDAEKNQAEANKKFNELQKLIEKLIIKIEGGEPLKGRCQECPEVDYASGEDQNLKEPEVTTAKDKIDNGTFLY